MNIKAKTLTILGMIGVAGVIGTTQASALNYMKDVNVQFTFNDTLNISLSSPNLVISDLTPGTASDSNIVTVTILSNNPYGYTLNSTVGSTTYTDRNLTNTSAVTSTPFSSINFGTTIASTAGFSNNQWGYSYSLDDGNTWINTNKTDGTNHDLGYSGLPLYNDSDPTHIATLKESDTHSAATGDNLMFKIAAKAASTQLSGEYQNVINFVATGAPAPPSCQSTITGSMQDFNPCSDIAIGTTGTLTDSRGGTTQSYTVAKLADGKWWMTENLNLAGGTALSSADTNVTDAYISSFTTSNNLTKNGNTIVLPASSTSGFNSNNYSYVYNSGNKTNCGASDQNTPCYSYYSWDAATLGSGRSISTDNTDAQQSICPKNWKLPSTYNGSGTAAAATDFRALMIGYGGSDSVQTYNTSTSPTGAQMYASIGPGTTPNFLLAGYYLSDSFYAGGSYGFYWSSTSLSNTNRARYLYFDNTYMYSAYGHYRTSGYSVRCLFSS